MSNYILSCCSTADLSWQWAKDRDIPFACFSFTVNGEPKKDDMGKTLQSSDLFKQMLAGAEVKTSQIGIGEYIAYFRGLMERGQDVLHVCVSSGLTGSYNSACVARDTILEEYPDRKLLVLDSLCVSGGYGMFVDQLADLRDEGYSLDALYEWGMEHRLKLQHIFFSTDLTFYIRGGRVSKTAGTLGSVLGICPLLTVDPEGKILNLEKVRTKKRAVRRTVAAMRRLAENGADYSGKCFMVESDKELARQTAELIKQTFPGLNGKPEIHPIGVTIGCHTGPGTVAVFFWGEERTF